MRLLRVTNIQRGCVYDGPGVRTSIFLKGCSLRCPWCCNPETISYEEQFFVDDSKCLVLQGKQSRLCDKCERLNGERSIHYCPFGVCERTSSDYSANDIYDCILRDKDLFEETGGGITLSGGEPILQAEALIPLLKLVKSENIHITFETTLMVPHQLLDLIIPFSDLFIIDLKLQPQMFLGKSDYLDKIRYHLSIISPNKKNYRMVFVDEVMTCKEQICEMLRSLAIREIEILLCHNLGARKYVKLGRKNEDMAANRELAKEFVRYLLDRNISAKLMSA